METKISLPFKTEFMINKLAESKKLTKVTMTTSVVAMSVALISALSFDANAGTAAATGDRYYARGEDGTHICFCTTSGTSCVCK